MNRIGILKVLVLLICGVSIVCFAACSTTAGGVEAGVHVGPEPTVYEGHEHHHGGPPPHAPAHGYRKKYTYRYYPDTEVYFDINRQVYFYIEGDQWQVTASLPSNVRIGLGDYVVIETDTSYPQEYHKEHKQKYPPGQQKDKHKNKNNKGKWGGDYD